jgi:RNA-directed DNA polymerase
MALSSSTLAFLPKLKLSTGQIGWIVENWSAIESGATRLYDEFKIQEGAKTRVICAPITPLKRIQQVLMHKFFYKFRPTDAAHGFVLGRSPVTNAEVHRKSRETMQNPKGWCLLQVDVENFFPSIPTNEVMRVISHLLKKRFECPDIPGVCEVILSLCQREGALPMGAPTSPVISNLVMARFDKVMMAYCKKHALTYTRYADDITISGVNANKAYRAVKFYLERMQLKLKAKKTRVLRPHRAMVVTGITINSGELTVSRKFRRRLRAQIHQTRLFVEKAWSPQHSALFDQPRPVALPVLEGRAGWCASVNPKHEKLADFVRGLRRVSESG